MICEKFLNKTGPYLYFVFRVLVGIMFFQHGAQKILGMFGGMDGAGGAASLISLMGLAGLIELIGGLAIATGFFTRLVASITALEIIIAYFMAHGLNAFWPILNKWELALLDFAAFLALIVYGAGKWSLEQLLLKKETF